MAPKRGERGSSANFDALSAQLLQARLKADDLLGQAQVKVQQPIRRIRSGLSDMSNGVNRSFTEAGQDLVDRGSATMQMLQQQPPLSQSLRDNRRPRGPPLRRVRSATDMRGRQVALPGSAGGGPERPWVPLETIPSQELQQTLPTSASQRAQFPSLTAPSVGNPRQVRAFCCLRPAAQTPAVVADSRVHLEWSFICVMK